MITEIFKYMYLKFSSGKGFLISDLLNILITRIYSECNFGKITFNEMLNIHVAAL